MSIASVARKDFLDVRRAKIVWFVASLYLLIAVLMFYFGQQGVDDPEFHNALLALSGNGAILIPLIALVTAYLAIAGERESGSIKYMLSIPNSRRDVVLGKFISRSAIVVGSILVAFALAGALGLLWYPSVDVGMFVGALALTTLFTLTYVSVAIGISAVSASRSRAMGGAIAVYFVTTVLANLIRTGFDWVFNDIAGLGLSSDALTFTESALSPMNAFFRSLGLVLPDDLAVTAPDNPWYLEPELMLVVLFVWLLVPLAIGIIQFERANLG